MPNFYFRFYNSNLKKQKWQSWFLVLNEFPFMLFFALIFNFRFVQISLHSKFLDLVKHITLSFFIFLAYPCGPSSSSSFFTFSFSFFLFSDSEFVPLHLARWYVLSQSHERICSSHINKVLSNFRKQENYFIR